MRRGIPLADINRAGHAEVLDVAVCAARERPTAPVLLSGAWMAGLSALMAAIAVRELGGAERLDISILASSEDRVGPDSWGFSERLPWPYYPMRAGTRRPSQPLTDVRRVRCADGWERPGALVGSLEQVTLPLVLGIGTVETRMALQSPSKLWSLVALKRSGTLRALARPSLRGVRAALLRRPGGGDFAGLTVTAARGDRSVAIDVLDPRGQSHLSAAGAVCAAERVLGLSGNPLLAGISFPEQSARRDADLATVRQAGAVVRVTHFTTTLPPARGQRQRLFHPALEEVLSP
jgi:hypothetical protein